MTPAKLVACTKADMSDRSWVLLAKAKVENSWNIFTLFFSGMTIFINEGRFLFPAAICIIHGMQLI